MPYDQTTRQDLPTYVVMDSNVLIAEDICGALQVFEPCHVIRITNLTELAKVVASDTVVSAAFLEMHFEEAINTAFADTFVRRGGKIVLTVGDTEKLTGQHGWSVLVRPFTEDMIHAVLKTAPRSA